MNFDQAFYKNVRDVEKTAETGADSSTVGSPTGPTYLNNPDDVAALLKKYQEAINERIEAERLLQNFRNMTWKDKVAEARNHFPSETALCGRGDAWQADLCYRPLVDRVETILDDDVRVKLANEADRKRLYETAATANNIPIVSPPGAVSNIPWGWIAGGIAALVVIILLIFLLRKS